MNTKPKLLIVDDDEINRFYLESFLISGFDVYTCSSVSNFYRLISTINFDLILMDIWLHDSKDGIQLTYELRRNPHYSNTPIIILSSDNTRKTHDDAIAVGATSIFDKSTHRKVIVRELKRYTQVSS